MRCFQIRFAYLSSRPGKTTYLFVNLVTLMYNVFNSFCLGYYRLLIILID